jgi:poly(3-hydroxybutyrate) depolymerase
MNFRRALVISLLACLACFIPQSARAGEGQLVSSTVRSAALEGNLLGDAADRSVIVYLPPSYDSTPTRRYPVVYLLHGNNQRNTVVDGRAVSRIERQDRNGHVGCRRDDPGDDPGDAGRQ